MLPEQFTARMKEMLGEEYAAFLEAYEQDRYLALRVNPLKADRESFLAGSPFRLTPVSWEQNGFYYSAQDAPGKHPYHEAGVYYIQEPSAMSVVPFLGAKPGEHILDLCAAPGGKTTQIAAAMQGEGILLANEYHPARAKILSENVERLGIRNTLVTNESTAHLSELFPGYFDRILVDAPCSGEGMFRKNEGAVLEWSPENVRLCSARQDEILDHAAVMLKAGGRLVYSTCTFAPAEDEGTVSRFLHRHPEFCLVPTDRPPEFAPGRQEWCEFPVEGIEYTCRLWPHIVKGEGHYLAVLQKDGELLPDVRVNGLYGMQPGIREREIPDYLAFAREVLRTSLEGVYLRFGDQLYLGPENMPSLNKLKCLRPGLHLGTFKKNRFEPSHALALSLKPREVYSVYALADKDSQTRAYLGGQTLASQGGAGWQLVTVDGYSIGWGKAAGGILKNHYPKGLRKY